MNIQEVEKMLVHILYESQKRGKIFSVDEIVKFTGLDEPNINKIINDFVVQKIIIEAKEFIILHPIYFDKITEINHKF